MRKKLPEIKIPLKFIYSEQTTKIWRNLQFFFGDFFKFYRSSVEGTYVCIWTLTKVSKKLWFCRFLYFSAELRIIFSCLRKRKLWSTLFVNWYFVTNIVLTYCEKNCSSDWEKLLKFEAEGREFSNILRSLEQFIQTVKVQNNFWYQNAFLNLFLEFSQI